MTDFKPPKARDRKGFTLFEVLATLVLLGILAVGVVSFTSGSSNLNLVAEADLIKSHLRYAQIRAQADIYEWRVIFTDATTYQIGPVVIPGQGFTPQIVPGTVGTEATLTDGISAASGTVIRFDSWGRPMDDANALLNVDKTITLTGGGRSEVITIRRETGLTP